MQQVWLALITGLTTGGISCLAVQGGLLASSVASVEGQGETAVVQKSGIHRFGYVGMFLAAKFISYAMLGYLLGSLGSTLTFAPKLMGTIQIVVGLFMIATVGRILDIHPFFRHFVIQPPRWSYRLLKSKSRNATLIAPAILGFLTVLMPCGVTQAMMAVAVASGNAVTGMAIMGAFVLGTSPIFLAIGASIAELLTNKLFSYVAAVVIAVFAVLSINGGMGLMGSIYTLQNFYAAATISTEDLALRRTNVAPTDGKGVQQVTTEVASNGYTSSVSTLKSGVPVHMTLKTNNTGGCARAFTIPDLNISKVLPTTGVETIDFTPTKTGRLAYSCSMGMFTGAFNVID